MKFLVICLVNMLETYIMFPGKIHVNAISPSEAPANFFSLQLKIQDGIYRYESPTWKLVYPFSSLIEFSVTIFNNVKRMNCLLEKMKLVISMSFVIIFKQIHGVILSRHLPCKQIHKSRRSNIITF